MHPTHRPVASLMVIAIAAFAAHARAHAQAPLTRADVIAQYEAAVRTGDLLAPGDSGKKLNELYPARYPTPTSAPALTRAQVVAELETATRDGDVLAPGDSGLRMNEVYPRRYPTRPAAVGKTREQVRAETLEAIRTGDIFADGDSGQKLKDLYPGRYVKAPSTHAPGQQADGTSPDARSRAPA